MRGMKCKIDILSLACCETLRRIFAMLRTCNIFLRSKVFYGVIGEENGLTLTFLICKCWSLPIITLLEP